MPKEDQGLNRSRSSQEGWPKWMYFAVPALVIFVVAGMYWALFSPPASPAETVPPTPTRLVPIIQPTQKPTEQPTLPLLPTATLVLPTLPPPTPTQETAGGTPEDSKAPRAPLSIGDKAVVCCTDNVGLRMRAGAGTGHPLVKTLPEGTILEIVGGPQEADGYTWWQVRDEVGTSGWVAADFLTKQE